MKATHSGAGKHGERTRDDRTTWSAVFDAVLARSLGSDLRGYDPYDGCNTRHRWMLRGKHLRLGLTYLHKFSPVNLRPVFGVARSDSVYTRAMVASALMRKGPTGAEWRVVEDQIRIILERSLIRETGYHSWYGNGFFMQARAGIGDPSIPGIVGTEAALDALAEYLIHRPERTDLMPVIESVRDYALAKHYHESSGRAFFKYKPNSPLTTCTYNASMKGAVTVMKANAALGSSIGTPEVHRSIEWLLDRQLSNGAWNYSIDFSSGKERMQIDYHQGFMVDGLRLYLRTVSSDPRVASAYERGLAFFRESQFTSDGRGLYRYPRQWPANIINQAQGIITFAESGDQESQAFARRIGEWTIANMYDGRGGFYFLLYPMFANKIVYMRWNQAWMLMALSHLVHGQGAEGVARPRVPPPSPAAPA